MGQFATFLACSIVNQGLSGITRCDHSQKGEKPSGEHGAAPDPVLRKANNKSMKALRKVEASRLTSIGLARRPIF